MHRFHNRPTGRPTTIVSRKGQYSQIRISADRDRVIEGRVCMHVGLGKGYIPPPSFHFDINMEHSGVVCIGLLTVFNNG